MSIIKINTAIVGVALIFIGCTTQVVKNDNPPTPKDNVKISLLVTSKTEKDCINNSRQLEEIIKENNLESIFESSWMVFSADPSNTDAFRITAEEKKAVLVLMKNEPNNWTVITVESNSKKENIIITPPITMLNDKEVGPFLTAFMQYYTSNFAGALDRFSALKNTIRNENKNDEATFWISSTLIHLGKTEEAISILDGAISNGTIINREVKGAALLAIAKLLTPEIIYDTLMIQKPKTMLIDAAELLRGLNSRYWALTQMGLGKLILLSAHGRSSDDMFIALSYFENAEMLLVYPKDELDIANLHLMMGRAYIILAQNMKESNDYIDKALYHFEVTKEIWYKHGDKEIELEGLSHEINYANSLRR